MSPALLPYCLTALAPEDPMIIPYLFDPLIIVYLPSMSILIPQQTTLW
jgi:hypothetical protein